MNNSPNIVKSPPKNIKLENLPKCLIIKANPSNAAVQNDSPLSAISMYACLLMNSIVLAMQFKQHSKQQITHLKQQPAVLLSFPKVCSTFLLKTSRTNIKNLIIAIISEPKARLPQWYLKALQNDFLMGWSSVCFSAVKYQMQALEA